MGDKKEVSAKVYRTNSTINSLMVEVDRGMWMNADPDLKHLRDIEIHNL